MKVELTPKEGRIVFALVQAQKGAVNMLRGFRKPTKVEQEENAEWNILADKFKQ